jgi:solute carrier family 50 protein (sugar transporter)
VDLETAMRDLFLQALTYPKLGSDVGTVEQVLGWTGTVASLYLFLSPLATIRKVFGMKGTQEYSDITYVVTCFNCSRWVAYAFLEGHRVQPFATNCAGLVLSVFYIAVFFVYDSRRRRLVLFGKVSLMLSCMCLVAVFCMIGGHGFDKSWATQLLGLVADVVNGVMYAAPLSVMCTVVRTASVEFMPLGLTLGCVASSIAWSAYSLWVGDVYIGLPNLVGCALGLMQLALYVKYGCCQRRVRQLSVDSTHTDPLANNDDQKLRALESYSQ